MRSPVIIDVIVAAALLGFLFAGVHRGLIRAAAGFVVLAMALVGAAVAANTLTPVVGEALRPAIEKRVERRIDKAIEEARPVKPQVGDEEGLTMDGLLSLLGIDADPAASIAGKAEDLIRDEGADLMSAVIQSVAESVLRVLIFAVAFPVLLIGLKLLVGVLDLAARLPGVHEANALGGGAVGLIEGALAVFLAVWVLRRLGVSFDTEVVEQTFLLRFFTTNTPLSILSAMVK